MGNRMTRKQQPKTAAFRKWTASAAALLIAFSFVLAMAQNAFAAESEYTDPGTGYRALLADNADLLDDKQETKLMNRMIEILAYGNVAFVTNDEPNSDAQALARAWYLDHLGEVSGTLLLIDMFNRRIEIFSGQEMFQTISTVRANEITDNVYTYATAGDYYVCADIAFDQMRTILEGRAILTPMKYATSAAFAVGIVFLVAFIILYTQRRKARNVMALRSAVDPEKTGDSGVIKRVTAVMTSQTKRRHTESSGGGGGGFSGGGGGGFSGGGGGGGGFSGGGGGHGF